MSPKPENYNKEISFIDKRIEDIAIKDKQAQIIMALPGWGAIRSMELLAEVGEISRFKNSNGKICSYAGLVPSVKQSGNTIRFGRLVKQSNKSLKNTLIQASWAAVRTKETNRFKLHYLKLSKKKGKQKAICAAARKMLCVIHAMLRKHEEYIA